MEDLTISKLGTSRDFDCFKAKIMEHAGNSNSPYDKQQLVLHAEAHIPGADEDVLPLLKQFIAKMKREL